MSDVRAGDEQYQSYSRPNEQQRRADFFDKLPRQWNKIRSDVFIGFWKGSSRAYVDGLNFRLGFRFRHSRFQSRDDFNRVVLPSILQFGFEEREWQPHIRPRGKSIVCRDNTDHGKYLRFQAE